MELDDLGIAWAYWVIMLFFYEVHILSLILSFKPSIIEVMFRESVHQTTCIAGYYKQKKPGLRGHCSKVLMSIYFIHIINI